MHSNRFNLKVNPWTAGNFAANAERFSAKAEGRKKVASLAWRNAFIFLDGNRFVWTFSRCVPSFWIEFKLSFCTSFAGRLRLDLLRLLLSSVQFCPVTFMQKTDAEPANSYIKWNFSAHVIYFYPFLEKESAHWKVISRARNNHKSAAFCFRGINIACKYWQYPCVHERQSDTTETARKHQYPVLSRKLRTLQLRDAPCTCCMAPASVCRPHQ